MSERAGDTISNVIQLKDLTVIIREIGEKYNSDMLAIMDRAPMQSKAIDLLTDRAPSIFYVPDFYYDEYQYYGFFVGEELHGFAMLSIKQSLVNGEPQAVFQFTDYYLDHSLRGRNLYYLSGPFIYGQLPTDCKVGYGIFLKGNLPIRSIAKRTAKKMAHVPLTRVISDLQIYSIFLLFRKKMPSGYDIRQAKQSDITEIVKLLAREHAKRLFGKHVSIESFTKELEQTPDLAIENYYLVRQDNVIVGIAAIWDTNSFNKIKVTKYGVAYRIVRLFHTGVAKAFGFHPLPAEGEHIRSLFVRDIVIKDRNPDLLHALLVNIYNNYRSKHYHVINVGMVKGDPLQKSFKHFLHEVVESQLVLGVFNPLELDDIMTNNPFIEFGVL